MVPYYWFLVLLKISVNNPVKFSSIRQLWCIVWFLVELYSDEWQVVHVNSFLLCMLHDTKYNIDINIVSKRVGSWRALVLRVWVAKQNSHQDVDCTPFRFVMCAWLSRETRSIYLTPRNTGRTTQVKIDGLTGNVIVRLADATPRDMHDLSWGILGIYI